MKIPVLDNGGQWTHREWRVLRDLGADTSIVPNTTPFAELHADGVVLSGGALSLEGTNAPLGRVGEWIDSVDVPVLAICVGHQYLGRHFGGKVVRSSPEFGSVDLVVDRTDHPLFAGLPGPIPRLGQPQRRGRRGAPRLDGARAFVRAARSRRWPTRRGRSGGSSSTPRWSTPREGTRCSATSSTPAAGRPGPTLGNMYDPPLAR